jgi:hypothetical protein
MVPGESFDHIFTRTSINLYIWSVLECVVLFNAIFLLLLQHGGVLVRLLRRHPRLHHFPKYNGEHS